MKWWKSVILLAEGAIYKLLTAPETVICEKAWPQFRVKDIITCVHADELTDLFPGIWKYWHVED